METDASNWLKVEDVLVRRDWTQETARAARGKGEDKPDMLKRPLLCPLP